MILLKNLRQKGGVSRFNDGGSLRSTTFADPPNINSNEGKFDWYNEERLKVIYFDVVKGYLL
jgi:hypothetical protein